MLSTAVVILNFNGKDHLEKFLPTVINTSPSADIIVVDNGSTDDSIAFLKSNFQTIRLLTTNQNLGFTGGYNWALDQLNHDICVLLNTDVKTTPGWIDPIIPMFQADPHLAAVQPKVLSWAEKGRFEYAGAGGGFIDRLGYPFCRGRIFQSIENDEGQFDDNVRCFWASGAAMFIRRQSFLEIGGFDEDYFAHMEEIDLCWRLQNAGRTIAYNGNSAVFHVGGGTLSKSNPNKTYYNFRNGLTMIFKNRQESGLWKVLAIRAFLDMVAALKFLVADSFGHSWAVFRGHAYFWSNFARIRQKRQTAKKQWVPESKTSETIYDGSIVYLYYLKGIRKFMDLSKALDPIKYSAKPSETQA